MLHALQFAIEGRKLSPDDFHDLSQPVHVTVWFEGIDATDLSRVTSDDHRERVEEMTREGCLTLVRTMPTAGTAGLSYMSRVPKDPHWSLEALNQAIAGKSGARLREAAVEALPELEKVLEAKPTTALVRTHREALVAEFPNDALTEVPAPLKTGIPASLAKMLPEVIYIEAVKDATAEAKTSESAAFGRLVKLLLGEVESHFDDIAEQFAEVQKKLSRVIGEDGEITDSRLDPVRMVESTIERFVQESFPDVSLTMDVPSPTLNTILGGAQLRINDGHEGLLSSKGDGLKRTVMFAILRAYTDLQASGLSEDVETSASKSSYLLLFEEPELYLHPRAQRQLMATLSQFSKGHPVLVTTHSPSFFGPSTTGFAKLHKTSVGVRAFPVTLDISDRDEYQIVRYENNEPAFFARTVVLVEGDSDVFTFPHLAKLLNSAWDHNELNIMFVKTGGKGSIGRYRDFFNSFNVPVHVITDLDALVDGFDKLTMTTSLREQRAALMALAAAEVETMSAPKSGKVKGIIARRNVGELWASGQEQFQKWLEEPSAEGVDQVRSIFDELFDLGRGPSKLAVLQDKESPVASQRDALISALALESVYVLSRGDLEAYLGEASPGDKVSQAIQFCDKVTTLDNFRGRHGDEADHVQRDLEMIFAPIYESVMDLV